MSIEAMNWALKQQLVSDSGACWVLMGLANHAREDGSAAFPSIATLIQYTKLSERTIRTKLRALEDLKVISKGNQRIAQALGYRPDRCPTVYDLHINLGFEWEKRAANVAPRYERAAIDVDTGGNIRLSEGQFTTERGATAAPETSFNHSLSDGNSERSVLGDAGQPITANQRTFGPLKSSMHRDWQPDAGQLKSEFFRRGLGEDVEWTAADLADFTAHYADLPGQQKSGAGWTNQFAKWVQANRRRDQQLEQSRQQRQGSNNRNISTRDDRDDNANRRPTSRKNYDPHAARARARTAARQADEWGEGQTYDGCIIK